MDSVRQGSVFVLPTRQQAYVLFMMVLTSLGGVLYGYDIGVISGALLFMKNDIAMSQTQLSLIVAAVLGGGSIATLISGILADRFGRRNMLIVSTFLFVVGVLILLDADRFAMLMTGRVIQGTGIGILIMVIPLYLVETAPASVRGRSVTLFQLFLTAGILLAYLVDLTFAPSGQWRSMFAFVLAPTLLLLIGSFFLTESPRWLMSQGKHPLAKAALLKSRTAREAEHDFLIMQQLLQNEARNTHSTLWQRRYLYPLLIALAIACLNQLTGINSFLQFNALIIQQSGIHSNITAIVGSTSVGLINFIATIIAIFFIDEAGRKPLLIMGTAGVVLALAFLGTVSTFLSPGSLQGYLVIAGMLVYIAFFAMGPGVVVWLALSELLPTAIRSKGIALCLFVNSMVSTLLASLFLDITKHLGLAANFWICAGFTLIYFFIAKNVLPETTHRTLEEIELYFQNQTETEEVTPNA